MIVKANKPEKALPKDLKRGHARRNGKTTIVTAPQSSTNTKGREVQI